MRSFFRFIEGTARFLLGAILGEIFGIAMFFALFVCIAFFGEGFWKELFGVIIWGIIFVGGAFALYYFQEGRFIKEKKEK